MTPLALIFTDETSSATHDCRNYTKHGGLPAPPEWVAMRPCDGASRHGSPGRARARSLLDVAEVLRLSAGGQSIAGIARRLDFAPAVVERWVTAAQRISRQSGYPQATLAEEPSFEGRALDAVGQALTDLVCDPTRTPPAWWAAVQELWCERYIHRLAAPYFSAPEEIIVWTDALLKLSVAVGDLRLYVPSNAQENLIVAATLAVRSLGVSADQVHRQHRSVNARSSAARRDPGIGVSVAQGAGRRSLAQTLARWMYCSAAHGSGP